MLIVDKAQKMSTCEIDGSDLHLKGALSQHDIHKEASNRGKICYRPDQSLHTGVS